MLISQYGYAAIFLLITLGFMGLPVPGVVLLTYLGFLISTGKMHFLLALPSALGGILCGISISYLVGLKWGEAFLYKMGPKLFIKRKTIKRTEHLFREYGSIVLVVSYFIPGIKKAVAYLSGITHFSFRRFALFAYSGALLWVSTFLALGYLLGSNWQRIITYLREYSWLAVFIGVVAIVFGVYVVKRHQNRTCNRFIDSDKNVKDKNG